MNKKNELRLKLLSRQQHIPKAKRPAALVASAAVAPVKRSKFENPRKPQPTSSLTNVTTAAGPSEAPQAKNQRNFLSHPVKFYHIKNQIGRKNYDHIKIFTCFEE
ncbi:unnamed protein product [Meloidogyne enterolobii]|uniref:Uncharacterized protein n=1 Tax=Meloidogyne enterolobii TaxID=390850 RepID=A0ACB0YD13_MELEN